MRADVVLRKQPNGDFMVILTSTCHENMGVMVVLETDGSCHTIQPQEIVDRESVGFVAWHLADQGYKVAIVP